MNTRKIESILFDESLIEIKQVIMTEEEILVAQVHECYDPNTLNYEMTVKYPLDYIRLELVIEEK